MRWTTFSRLWKPYPNQFASRSSPCRAPRGVRMHVCMHASMPRCLGDLSSPGSSWRRGINGEVTPSRDMDLPQAHGNICDQTIPARLGAPRKTVSPRQGRKCTITAPLLYHHYITYTTAPLLKALLAVALLSGCLLFFGLLRGWHLLRTHIYGSGACLHS